MLNWSYSFWQRCKVIQWRKDSLFKEWCWNNWMSIAKKMNLGLSSHNMENWTQNGLLWPKCKRENYKTFRRQYSRKSLLLRVSWQILRHDIKGIIHKKIDKLDFLKIKNLCSVNDPVKKMKRQATKWEKIFSNNIFGK